MPIEYLWNRANLNTQCTVQLCSKILQWRKVFGLRGPLRIPSLLSTRTVYGVHPSVPKIQIFIIFIKRTTRQRPKRESNIAMSGHSCDVFRHFGAEKIFWEDVQEIHNLSDLSPFHRDLGPSWKPLSLPLFQLICSICQCQCQCRHACKYWNPVAI